jgi:hypothetical protein
MPRKTETDPGAEQRRADLEARLRADAAALKDEFDVDAADVLKGEDK